MSDVFLFLFGLLVTLIVSSAVGFLLWGANHERRDAERGSAHASPGDGEPVPVPAAVESARGR